MAADYCKLSEENVALAVFERPVEFEDRHFSHKFINIIWHKR